MNLGFADYLKKVKRANAKVILAKKKSGSPTQPEGRAKKAY